VGDEVHGPAAGAPHDLRREVRLPAEPVDVVRRLVREPEAEEVEARDRAPGVEVLEQRAPVVRGRWEAMQEDDERPVPGTVHDVDPVAAELDPLATPPPVLDPRRERHGGRLFQGAAVRKKQQ
jgi:hypothetical protein